MQKPNDSIWKAADSNASFCRIMSPLVINLKHKSPYDIYIGRENKSYGLEASPFANPFIIGKHGTREEVIEKYRLWINSQPELLRQLKSLKGKRLVGDTLKL